MMAGLNCAAMRLSHTDRIENFNTERPASNEAGLLVSTNLLSQTVITPIISNNKNPIIIKTV